MEILNAAILDLAHEVSLFSTHLDALKQTDVHLEEWNSSFGRLTGSVALLQRERTLDKKRLAEDVARRNAIAQEKKMPASLEVEHNPSTQNPPTTGLGNGLAHVEIQKNSVGQTTRVKPEVLNSNSSRGPLATQKPKKTLDVSVNSETSRKTQTRINAWTPVREKILGTLPRKYSQPDHTKRLERIYCAIVTSPGCALGDIVRCCGCSVLQVNEYLATLVKHGHVARKKTRTNLAYFVQSSDDNDEIRSMLPRAKIRSQRR